MAENIQFIDQGILEIAKKQKAISLVRAMSASLFLIIALMALVYFFFIRPERVSSGGR